MTLLLTARFKEDFRQLPKAIQRRTEKTLRLLAENLRHPSLRAKKMEGVADIWEARVTKGYRLTFQIQQDTYILRRVGSHEEALRNP